MKDSKITVCLPYDGPLVQVLQELGAEVRVFRLAVMRRKYFSFFGVIDFFIAAVLAYFRLVWMCKRRKVTMIYSNTSAVIIGAFVSRTLSISHVWHVREIHVHPIVIRKWVTWLLSNMADKVIGVSEATIDNLKIDNPEIGSKSIVINNGINIEDYKVDSDAINVREELGLTQKNILVGMIGRVSHWKGQDLFLKVADKVLSEHPNCHFLALGSPFTGQDQLMDDFVEESRKISGSERFHIRPFDPKVISYLNAFDVFVLPSTLPDPFPTTVLEAMLAKKAIVVNGHGGAVEMIRSNESGFIVTPPNDVDKFTQTISVLIESAETRKEFGSNAYERVNQEFTERIYAENMRKLFSEYLN